MRWPVEKRTGAAEDDEQEDPLDFVAQVADKDWTELYDFFNFFMYLNLCIRIESLSCTGLSSVI